MGCDGYRRRQPLRAAEWRILGMNRVRIEVYGSRYVISTDVYKRQVSVRVSTATTEGSRMMMPLPFIKIKVLAVPRSTPISLEKPKFKFKRSKNDMWR